MRFFKCDAPCAPRVGRADLARLQIFNQLSNERGTRLYKLQKRFQAVFGFTLRAFLLVVCECTAETDAFPAPAAIFFGRGLFNCASRPRSFLQRNDTAH